MWKTRVELHVRKKESTDTKNETSKSGNVQIPNVRLPRLSIDKFNGDPANWQTFWSQFQSSIHENESLNAADKFNYLKSFLGGTAASAVAGLSVTADNYDSAIKILSNRFGRKDVIISTHMQNLLSLEPVRNSSDVHGLRKLYDTCEVQIRSLQAVGVDSVTYSSLLCPVLMKTVPRDVALEFSKRRETDLDWDLSELLKTLRLEVESRERANYLTKQRDSSSSMHNKSKNEKRDSGKQNRDESRLPSAAALKTGVTYKCMYCGSEEHTRDNCTKSIPERREVLLKESRCYVCLRRNHTAKFCRVRGTCPLCHRRHHRTLCEVGLSGETEKEKETSPNTLVASVSSPMEGNRAPTMFLQTAQAVVKGTVNDMIIRCLLDSGSQRTFIREEVSRKMKLPVVGTETLQIHTFGNDQPKEVTRNRVRVTLQNTNNPNKSVIIEALETPNIGSALVEIPQGNITLKMKELGLPLADGQEIESQKAKQLDLIIGSEYYWQIVTGKTHRLNNNLVALETIFGWSVHGPAIVTALTEVHNLTVQVMNILVSNEDEVLSSQIKQFWEVEHLGIKESETNDVTHQEVLDKFNSTIEYNNGRYKVELPWKPEQREKLQNNREIADSRFEGLVKRFKRNPSLYFQYDEVIQDYLSSGIIEEIKTGQDNNNIFFICHINPSLRGKEKQQN